MSYIVKVADLELGGDGRDNPPDLSLQNYNLSPFELKLTFVNQNVICSLGSKTYQVTGLAVWDPLGGVPLIGPNDDIRMPCPPYCT